MPEEQDTTAAPSAEPEESSEQENAAEGTHYKYRKLLYLFKFSKHHKKIQKKKAAKSNTLPPVGTPEERRNQLDQDIKNSWDTLPETLRKRKQRVSRALLSEFIDADNPESGDGDAAKAADGTASGSKESEVDDAGAIRACPDDKAAEEKTSKELDDAMHRSGVYFDDEDVEDEEEDTRSSASSGSAERNEVCIYQVHRRKSSTSEKGGVEILTKAIFHKQDENDNEIIETVGSNEGTLRNNEVQSNEKNQSSGGFETQVGEEEIYQKITIEAARPENDSSQKCYDVGLSKNVVEESSPIETDTVLPCVEEIHLAVETECKRNPLETSEEILSSPAVTDSEAGKEITLSDSDSGVEASKTESSCDVSHSSLSENNGNCDEADYATVGTPSPVVKKEPPTAVDKESLKQDALSAKGVHSHSQAQPSIPEPPKPPPCLEESPGSGPGSGSGPASALGLDSEALAAVEMLARAVSSDSLLLESRSGGSSPANSHASLNMKRDDDDSGTDVNIPSSSSNSSSSSSCAGDAPQPTEGGEYEDVTPMASECPVSATKSDAETASVKTASPPLPPPNHHYEAMLTKSESVSPTTNKQPLYSAVGKPKLPAPGAQPLPGMYSDMSLEGSKPQFLLEALSKRAAVAEMASKASKQEDEEYTEMAVNLRDKTNSEKGRLNKVAAKYDAGRANGMSVKTSEAAISRSADPRNLPLVHAAGCVAPLAQLSAQNFPPVLTAPIFYNPLAQCQTHGTDPLRDDGGRSSVPRQCPLLKHALPEPVSSAASDSEHLTDSFDEDETSLPSGKPGLLEEPLWRRPPEPASCSWRSAVDPLLCRRSVTMETIVEEPTAPAAASPFGGGGPDDSRLTVREILRRFEELGGKVPSLVGSCDGEQGGVGTVGEEEDEEKSATLREIQETLMNLEEKVRNYQCKMAADKPGSTHSITPTPPPNSLQQQPQQAKHHHHHHHHHVGHQRSGGRLDSLQPDGRKSLEGWTGRVSQHQPPQQQAQPQQPQQLQQQPHHALTNGHHPHPHPHSGPASLPSMGPLSEHGSAQGPGQGQGQGQGQVHDGKHSLLQFAIHHFRQSPEKFEMLKTADGSISGSLDVIESLKAKKNKGKSKGNKENEWTWKEQVDLVKFSPRPIEQSLLRLETAELSELAVECFVCVMRYMGDLPMTTDVTEVKCVYTVLMHCHKHEALRDEVYCQLMKQTTNNKSQQPESCQRGWRLFSIVAAYFTCTDTLKPYLFKYLETAAYDKRRAYHGTAMVCLQNLRKTFKYGGRKNVPSVEEITAISAGRNSKRQMYRLPGGTERVVNTRSTTVVQDVIEEICGVINVTSAQEMEEFSLYCIVEGDTFTMPLAREEYILDVTTELHKNQQVFYLIFCRSVWHFPLRLDSHLYIEVVFNQIAPDYLEGLLLVMPGETLQQDTIYEIAKMAALLHRAADMTHVPAMKETKFLLPKPALTVRDIKPAQWVNMVQSSWVDVQGLETIQAKAQVLEMLSRWPLFGSSFFAVKRISDPKERADHILALNRHGVHFIDIVTHETLLHHPFSEVISTRKVKSEDGILFLDMKCGNLMQQRITRLQTDQAHEISRLIRQYITLQQRVRT